MNRYLGTFYNKNITDAHPKGDVIQVEITPSSGTYDDTIDLDFPFDEPVIITQESDGIFTPVKTQGATISIFTEEIFWELYASSPFSWRVSITRLNDEGEAAFTYFRGFLTPCAYTQDYAYNGVLELEAVDCLAALEQMKYRELLYDETLPRQTRSIVTASMTILQILDRLPIGATYSLIQHSVPKALGSVKLMEANFFDEDDEPMVCKEVIEEIMSYLGYTILMYDGSFHIIDTSTSMSELTTLDAEKYSLEVQPTIETEECYNKFSVSDSVYEVDTLFPDPFEDSKCLINQFSYSKENDLPYTQEQIMGTDDDRWYAMLKPYTFVNDAFWAAHKDTTEFNGWYSHYIDMSTREELDQTIDNLDFVTNNNCNLYMYEYSGSSSETSKSNLRLCVPKYQACIPMRQYSYKVADDMDAKDSIEWNEYLCFPTVYWNPERNESTWYDTDHVYDSYYRIEYFAANRCWPSINTDYTTVYTVPALSYVDNNEYAYSMPKGIAYITINAKAFIQAANVRIKDRNSQRATIAFQRGCSDYDTSNKHYGYMVPSLSCAGDVEIEYNRSDKFIGNRTNPDDPLLNSGWTLFKAKLQIGDKYWNGTSWTTTDSYFTLNFHTGYVAKSEVEDDGENFDACAWMPIAPNIYDTLHYSNDKYAIPITASDAISGIIKFTIYCPMPICKRTEFNNRQDVHYTNVYLKDFEVKYEYMPDNAWISDATTDDDVVYENELESFETYDQSMGDKELKINSWYLYKPLSRSFALDASNRPLYEDADGLVQEEKLIKKYYDHFSPVDGTTSKPAKKIFNVGYHIDNMQPTMLYEHTGILSEGKTLKMMCDSYELNLKSYYTTLKLVEI